MIVSLEQAYHLFLRPKNSAGDDERLTIAEYLVYSQFMRFGCNIQKYREDKTPTPESSEDNDTPKESELLTAAQIPENLYVWNYLYELLGHRKNIIASTNIDPESYNRVKTSMDETIHRFRDVAHAESNCSVKRKRSIDYDSSTQFSRKSAKLNHDTGHDDQYVGSGSTNDFMVGNEFEKFKDIFDKIDVIKLKSADAFDSNIQTELRFSFDLWTSKDNTKQTTAGPNFRIIIQ